MTGAGRRRSALVAVSVLVWSAGIATGGSPAVASGVPPDAAGARTLSWNGPLPAVASTYGSGHFGQWSVDRFGLPSYQYTADQQTDPVARQAELAGATDAWSQVGNDRVKADAFNHGYTELWSQDRLAQWIDALDPARRHLGGGFGYLNVDGTPVSTLYDDRPQSAAASRTFGVGYFAHSISLPQVAVRENVYAPFGNDPVLVHDVRITNRSAHTENISWFEYWDVNPYVQNRGQHRGMSVPVPSDGGRTLTVAQRPLDGDNAPLSVFLAQLTGHTTSFTTSQESFFGDGTVSRPQAVVADRLDDHRATPVPNGTEGTTLFALRSPNRLRAGQSLTLRYLYGYAEPGAVEGLVSRYRTVADPLSGSERAWVQSLPKAAFGSGLEWLSREFLWDAYLLRSATVDEQLCGQHTVTQGGYYQYEEGNNWGTRSWLQYAVPLSFMAPGLARQILVYSGQFQPRSTLQFPYGSTSLCAPYQLGTSDDFDFWFMWAAATYGLATRDTGFFATPVRFSGSVAEASLWQHVKLAFAHQQSLLGPHGEYRALSVGDWSDLLPTYSGMTESDLVVAQCAYTYPLLADVADLRGDRSFATRLRQAAAGLLATLRAQWTGQGWYARGFAGDRQLGAGAPWLEPQPWAILAGAPSPAQAPTLVANIRRYLDGIGAPADLGGPDRIGTSLSPAASDPGITETTAFPGTGEGDNNAVYPGGTWYEPDGWLAWAYATLGDRVPGSGALALDEYERSTLADHAAWYPDEWVGTTSIDDTCWSFYSSDPGRCGGVLGITSYEGQNTEQPEWMVMDALDLAGVTPTRLGYRITPHLPLPAYSVRFPIVGLAGDGHSLAGYLRPLAPGRLLLQVAVPAGARAVVCRVDGAVVRPARSAGSISVWVTADGRAPVGWSVAWR